MSVRVFEWADGYRAALTDVAKLAQLRSVNTIDDLSALLDDLNADALVIEREHDNRLRRLKLRIEREALPLFDKDNAP